MYFFHYFILICERSKLTYEQKNYMYEKNIDSKNLLPELTRSKANTKAIAFCRRKLRGLDDKDMKCI